MQACELKAFSFPHICQADDRYSLPGVPSLILGTVCSWIFTLIYCFGLEVDIVRETETFLKLDQKALQYLTYTI